MAVGVWGKRISIQPAAQKSATYQVVLVAILSINFGIVFFDRNSLNFLMPFVQPELGIITRAAARGFSSWRPWPSLPARSSLESRPAF
jgi:hypothetical protein